MIIPVENSIHETYKCLKCGKIYNDRITAKRHRRIHMARKHICQTCGAKFAYACYLKQHEASHSDSRKLYKCKVCDKTFKEKRYLENYHMKEHKQEFNFSCDLCEKKFIKIWEHRDHFLRYNSQLTECPICQKLVKPANLNYHISTHKPPTERNKYIKKKTIRVCEICGKHLTSLTSYDAHMRRHNNEKPYLCNVCGKNFVTSKDLRLHEVVHTGLKLYKCKECDKSFTQLTPLTIHKRIHSGERPYECDVCKKRFISKSALNAHSKTHGTE